MNTLINNFHNTEVRTKKTDEEIDRIVNTRPEHRSDSDKQWAKRVRRDLCGINGCTCGDEIGRRG